MKAGTSFRFIALTCLLVGLSARADSYYWINTSGGDWNEPSNWDLDAVPTLEDDVYITADGTYTVTLSATADVGSLTLGASSGTQTLLFTGEVLRLNNENYVTQNGVLDLRGHLGSTYFGANLTVNGTLNWVSGQLAIQGAVIIGSGGLLTVAGNTVHDNYAGVYNAGTLRVTGTATLRQVAYGGVAYVVNQPGGLFEIQDDASFPGYAGGNEWIDNQGTMRKTGGTGTTSISVTFYNSGTLDVQSGTVNLNYVSGNGYYTAHGNGTFQTAAGTAVKFNTDYTFETGALLTGAGSNYIGGNLLTMNGTRVAVSNATINTGTLTFSNVVFSGKCQWLAGDFEQRGNWTIAPGATLRMAIGGVRDYRGTITNAGTLQLTNNLHLRGQGIFSGGKFYNQPGAVVDLQDDAWLTSYTFPSEIIVNQGTIRKSGGNGLSFVFAPTLESHGTLDVQSGRVQIPSGNLDGATLKFGINSLTNYGQLTLNGGNPLNGTFIATLNNGYVPVNGNSFTNIMGGSWAGGFTNLVLPPEVSWRTNFYGSSSFVLTVIEITPPTMESISYSEGEFDFQISGTSGLTYVISTSTNLTDWADVFTNAAASTPFDFSDPDAGSFARRYYRVRCSP